MNKELDIKMDDLFRWKGEFTITDQEGKAVETVYQRVIGDSDVQKARTQGLKASRLLRKELHDPESDMAIANLPFDGEQDREDMLSLILLTKYSDFRRIAEAVTEEKRVPDPPSDAGLEEQEQYIANLDAAKIEYEEKIADKIQEMSEDYKKNFDGVESSKLFEEYIKNLINMLCLSEMNKVFNEYSAFFGTFSDAKFTNRRFETIEEFRNLIPSVKNQVMNNYKMIELNLIDAKK